jgi:hypothetical protein
MTARRLRAALAVSTLSIVLVLLNAAAVLAGGGGTTFPH